MGFKTDEDRQVVIDMIKAGQGMPEIIALDVCNQADVYNLRHILKSEGVIIKKTPKATSEDTPAKVIKGKSDTKNVKSNCPAWLEGLLREQEKLQEHLRRIDALVAMYDDLIPLPKTLQH
jgi:hypothetical protein